MGVKSSSDNRLAICIAAFLGFHLKSALTVCFQSGFSSFPLDLTLLGHFLVNALHLEYIFHLRFFIVLREKVSSLCYLILFFKKCLTVWFNRKISAARPSAIV